jgi:hypothetical protein
MIENKYVFLSSAQSYQTHAEYKRKPTNRPYLRIPCHCILVSKVLQQCALHHWIEQRENCRERFQQGRAI